MHDASGSQWANNQDSVRVRASAWEDEAREGEKNEEGMGGMKEGGDEEDGVGARRRIEWQPLAEVYMLTCLWHADPATILD